ncbi:MULTISPECIES: DUF3263 domain-containing protein [Aurantimicrobium]|uniref:DUF3263 domain-containing protein n=1 Tax=Aurantimicrobium photophilum TaxID=1987356 RepID=A0A2Z3RZP2_9MICO|nr:MULTISPECIES: DUF3263 domain-containing protein [Aurantimicrobium]AWR22021.1 hypothetical protein AURMO_01432 [Aurantimicrobium photophilum]MDH6207210.1 hypothetical protein [Aurantimicrobium minutum]
MFDERDRAILDFEREWWQHPGAKEDAIRQTFGLSPARYYQVLGKLMDSEAALAYDPMLVKRLKRVRDDRRSSRQKRINPDSSEKN